jgi:hypothetical protein
MWMKVDQARDAARLAGIGEPHVVHFCFMPQGGKMAFGEKRGLRYLGADGASCVVPDKHVFDSWKARPGTK